VQVLTTNMVTQVFALAVVHAMVAKLWSSAVSEHLIVAGTSALDLQIFVQAQLVA
jgi:hypothetical protein